MFKWPLMWRKTHEKKVDILKEDCLTLARENMELRRVWEYTKPPKEKKKPAKKKGKKNVV